MSISSLSTVLLGLLGSSAPAWRGLPAPPLAIPLTMNSHTTATAWVVRYLGAAKPDEADRTLVATAWVYIRGCPTCADSGPSKWDISAGLSRMLADRGKACTFDQSYRCGGSGSETACAAGIAEAPQAGRPALVTFCYERVAAIPGVAVQRGPNSFTVAAIGVLTVEGKDYLVARDGVEDPRTCEAARDRVAAADIGLDTGDRRWCDKATAIYCWQAPRRP